MQKSSLRIGGRVSSGRENTTVSRNQSGFRSGCVTGIVKEVAAFCWREEVGDATDSLSQALDGALGGFAQQCLVFGRPARSDEVGT
jgi:hypothetical protein